MLYSNRSNLLCKVGIKPHNILCSGYYYCLILQVRKLRHRQNDLPKITCPRTTLNQAVQPVRTALFKKGPKITSERQP